MHSERAATGVGGRLDVRRTVLALLLVLATASVFGTVSQMLGPTGARDADYVSFQTGGRLVADGHGAQLYDLAAQTAAQHLVVPGRTFPGGVLPWVNPPHWVAPFALLARLGLRPAYLVWGLVNLLALAALFAVLRRLAAGWSRTEVLLGAAAALAFGSLRVAFVQGQPSVAVTLGLAAFAVAFPHCRRRGAGDGAAAAAPGLLGRWRFAPEAVAAAGLLLASAKPQYVVLPGLVALVQRRHALVAWAAGLGVPVAAATTAAFGPGVWADYGRLLEEFDGSTVLVHPHDMWNLRSLLVTTVLDGREALAHSLATAFFLAAAAATVWLWRRPVTPGPATDGRMALLLVAAVLASPHTYTHDALPLVLAGVLTWSALRSRRDASPRLPVAVVLLAGPLLSDVGLARLGSFGGQMPVLGMLVLAVLLVRSLEPFEPFEPVEPVATPRAPEPAERTGRAPASRAGVRARVATTANTANMAATANTATSAR